jgi:hypothetical protein
MTFSQKSMERSMSVTLKQIWPMIWATVIPLVGRAVAGL